MLSIVIPAFNVERFILRCVDSVMMNDCPIKVEVIIVNDGSTDRTAEIVKEKFACGPQLRVINQENRGLGAARNVGLNLAKGDYVWFVDSDDFLRPGALDFVLKSLERKCPDVLVVDLSCADESGKALRWITSGFESDVGQTLTGSQFFCRHYRTTYVWLYIFKRSILVDNGIRFQPSINMQDAEFLPRVMALAKTVFVSGISAYVYVKRSTSYVNSGDVSVRNRYFRSVLEVRQLLSAQHDQARCPKMRLGLGAKINAIDGILLMSYIYDNIQQCERRDRLKLLKSQNVYPFGVNAAISQRISKKILALRTCVNYMPYSFPILYRIIRTNRIIRFVRQNVASKQ